jgi:hypothetical protein
VVAHEIGHGARKILHLSNASPAISLSEQGVEPFYGSNA